MCVLCALRVVFDTWFFEVFLHETSSWNRSAMCLCVSRTCASWQASMKKHFVHRHNTISSIWLIHKSVATLGAPGNPFTASCEARLFALLERSEGALLPEAGRDFIRSRFNWPCSFARASAKSGRLTLLTTKQFSCSDLRISEGCHLWFGGAALGFCFGGADAQALNAEANWFVRWMSSDQNCKTRETPPWGCFEVEDVLKMGCSGL